jgi:GT2 family glycosyltransferase
MRFSILIPTFNRAELLGQAIQSSLAQTYSDREIIVIDDGSTDETHSVISEFGQTIHYLRQENRGKAAALNLGISASKGDVLIVLDDDDVFPSWAVTKHAEALERNPTADFSYGRFARFHGKSLPPAPELWDKEFVPTEDPRRLVVKLMENCFLPNPAWAVRREAQVRVGLYNEYLNYSQDYDMILRLARANDGALVNDIVLYQRKHESHRGPASERTYALDTLEKWIEYDALIFDKLDQNWELSDFRPFHDEAHPPDEAAALIQKGVIFFQRKLYDRAAHALAAYRRRLDTRPPTRIELRIAAGLLGCRYGIDDLLVEDGASKDVIGLFRAEGWPLLMRIAMASQLRWRFRAALGSGNARNALKLVRFSCNAFGIPATVAMLGSRYSAGASQWRRMERRGSYF